MNQTEILIHFTKLQNPLFDAIALVLTFLGNEEFYFLILPFIYWCVSKPIGFRLFYVFLLSIFVNSFLKITYAIQRPIGTEGVNSIFVSSAEVGSHYPYDSFPSGHAQGSATLWGYLAYVVKRPSFTFFAIMLILFISLSRLYAGLHWPSDIIIGASLGLLFVIIAIVVQEKIAKLPKKLHWLLAIFVPIALLIVFTEPEGIKYSGFIFGAGIGYLVEARFVKMVIDKVIWRKLVAFVFGMIGIIGLQVGLKVIFPEAILFDFIRYCFIGLWGLVGAPYLFVKLGIYRKQSVIKVPIESTISK